MLMEKEKACELIGTSSSNLKKFTMETKDKNIVKGFICKSRGEKMGSLLIDTVNDVETHQYVQGMPKIKYLDQRYANEVSIPNVLHKEDGTNVVAFPLIDNYGEWMETCFKSRGLPNLDNPFLNMVGEIFNNGMYESVEENKLSFSYELYGMRNRHEVDYQIQDIDLTMSLLTVLDQGRSLPTYQVDNLAEEYHIPQVLKCFDVKEKDNGYIASITNEFCIRFGDFIPDSFCVFGDNLFDLYKAMEAYFEKMNIAYQQKMKGGIITEGSVWHYTDKLEDGFNWMVKCKAMSVREGHIKAACGIPANDIRKALSKAKENLNADLGQVPINEVLSYVKTELEEEYPVEIVNTVKTEDKIKSSLNKLLYKFTLTEDIKKIVDRVHQEIDISAAPADKMRVFAQLFPDAKSKGGKVYQAMVGI